jgi:hypothetical protein
MRERMQQRGAMMLRFLDANSDGRVALDELRPMAEAWFRARDADSDGFLSRDEVRHMRGDRGPGGQGRGGPPRPPAAQDGGGGGTATPPVAPPAQPR